MKHTISKSIIAACAFAATTAHAHPGHDHADAGAGFIHLLWFGLPVVALGALYLYGRSQKNKEQ